MSIVCESLDTEYVNVTDASRILRVSRATVERLVEVGKIGSIHVPFGRPRLSKSDVMAILAASTRKAVAN